MGIACKSVSNVYLQERSDSLLASENHIEQVQPQLAAALEDLEESDWTADDRAKNIMNICKLMGACRQAFGTQRAKGIEREIRTAIEGYIKSQVWCTENAIEDGSASASRTPDTILAELVQFIGKVGDYFPTWDYLVQQKALMEKSLASHRAMMRRSCLLNVVDEVRALKASDGMDTISDAINALKLELTGHESALTVEPSGGPITHYAA